MTEIHVTERRARITCPCGCKHTFTVRSFDSPGLTPKQARKIGERMNKAFAEMNRAFRLIFSPGWWG